MNGLQAVPNLRLKAAGDIIRTLGEQGLPGVVILSGYGAGQKLFMQQLLETIDLTGVYSGLVQLQGIRGLEDVSFAALLGVLDEEPKMDDFAGIVRHLDTKLRELATEPSQRVLVVVEDADYLDAATAYVLTQMVQARRIGMLIVSAVPIKQVPNLEPLSAVGNLATVALERISKEELASACQSMTGAQPTTGSLAMLRSLTGGVHDFVLMVLRHSIERFGWSTVAGYSLLLGQTLEVDGDLLNEVWQSLQQLDEADFEVLALVSMRGMCQETDLVRHFPEETTRLARSGLIERSSSGSIVSASKLVDNAICRFLPPTVVRKLYENESNFRDRESSTTSWRRVFWSLMAGHTASDRELAEAARFANDDCQYAFALNLATVGGSETQSVLRRIQAYRAIGGRRRFTECQAGFESLASVPLNSEDAEQLTSTWLCTLMNHMEYVDRLGHAARIWAELEVEGQTALGQNITRRIELATTLGAKLSSVELGPRIRQFMGAEMPLDVRVVALIAGLESRTVPFDALCINEIVSERGNGISSGLVLRARKAARILQIEDARLDEDTEVFIGDLGLRGVYEYTMAATTGCLSGMLLEQQGKYLESQQRYVQAALDYALGEMGGFARYSAIQAILQSGGIAHDNDFKVVTAWAEEPLGQVPALYRSSSQLISLVTFGDEKGDTCVDDSLLLEQVGPELAIKQLWHWFRFDVPNEGHSIAQLVRSWLDSPNTISGKVNQQTHRLLSALPDDLETMESVREWATEFQVQSLATSASSCILLAHAANSNHKAASLRHLYTLDNSVRTSRLVAYALQRQGLTDRELEIASLVAEGMSNRELALVLRLSVRTVEGHAYRILSKLGLQQRGELHRLGILANNISE